MPKPRKNPEAVRCAGCGRTLILAEYMSDYPDPSVPPDSVTWMVDPAQPGYCVNCGCGHFTVIAKFQRRPAQ